VRVPGLVEQGRCWPSQAEAAFARPVVGPAKGRAPSMSVVDCARGGGATVRRRRPDRERARHIVMKVVVLVVVLLCVRSGWCLRSDF
jgi:hypothetical protein